MGRMKAFFAALCLFILTAVCCHFYGEYHIGLDKEAYAFWTAESKSQSYAGLTRNMEKDTIPVFGSSEFQHGTDTRYHPSHLLQDTGFAPMLIGAGYYQTLSHSVTLAAIEPYMQTRKAVLILSPQWFRKTGVLSQAYTSRFNELFYEKMLDNEALSDETVSYISERTHTLLSGDEQVLARISLMEKIRQDETPAFSDLFYTSVWSRFLAEKDRFSICAREGFDAGFSGMKRSGGQAQNKMEQETENKADKAAEPDWESLLAAARQEGETENDNEFFIDNRCYEQLVPHLDKKRGMNRDAQKGYQTGPEFQDLAAFLSVCRETGITPLVVIVPVNGYYYDFTEFPASARAAYYEKVRGIAEDYGAQIADFSGEEYTRYFFEDRVHLGKTGWIKTMQAVWRFAQEA